MSFSRIQYCAAALALLAIGSAPRAEAQATPYYVADGDAQNMFVVQGGVIIGSFAIPSLGYPLAIRNTVWVGDRDDNGATEFTLAGVATGNTGVGGGNFSQLLDGTTNGINNFGVECCDSVNSLTIANLDWSGQTALASLEEQGNGVAFDSLSGHLFVGGRSNTLYEYTIAGGLIGSFAVAGLPSDGLASLAYEASSDTLWSSRGRQLFQLDKSGNVLQSLVLNATLGNNFGGEMQLKPSAVPEASSLALFCGALLPGAYFLRRRRK
jgi:hypothetical protein